MRHRYHSSTFPVIVVSFAVSSAVSFFCVKPSFSQWDGSSEQSAERPAGALATKKSGVPEPVYKDGYDGIRKLFRQAVIAGDTDICKELLEKNAYYVNETDGDGRTQLHYAAASGQTAMCRLLLDHGARADFPQPPEISAHYSTPLEAAIANNHTETAILLIDSLPAQAFKPIRGCNRRALFLAIQNENPEIIKSLLAKPVDVDAPIMVVDEPALFQTPLYVACAVENVAICNMLLHAGASLDYEQGKIRTAESLFVAALARNETLCSLLIDSKINLDTRNAAGRTVLHELLRSNVPLAYFRSLDESAFRNVSPFDVAMTTKRLVAPYPRPDAKRNKAPGDVGNGVQNRVKNDVENNVENAAVAGVNEREKSRESDSAGIEYRLCKRFIEAGANVDACDEHGCSVLETLILFQTQARSMKSARPFDEFKKFLDLFIDANVDLNARDDNGWTPLNYLLFYSLLDFRENESRLKEEDIRKIAESKVELFKTLIDAGATVKTADKDGNTLLHYLVSAPGTTLEKGGYSFPLNYDPRGKHRTFSRMLIELLIEKGASLNDENKEGETPLDWATRGPRFQNNGKIDVFAPGPSRELRERAITPVPMPSNPSEAADMLMR